MIHRFLGASFDLARQPQHDAPYFFFVQPAHVHIAHSHPRLCSKGSPTHSRHAYHYIRSHDSQNDPEDYEDKRPSPNGDENHVAVPPTLYLDWALSARIIDSYRLSSFIARHFLYRRNPDDESDVGGLCWGKLGSARVLTLTGLCSPVFRSM
jgi:hypothetical protein